MLTDLVAMRGEYIARVKTVVGLRDVVPVEDVTEDVLAEAIKDLSDPFALFCMSDEAPQEIDLDDDGTQLLEHDIAVIIGVDARLQTSRDKASVSSLQLKQAIKAVLRPPWYPTQAFGKRSPRYRGSNRVGRFKSIALYGLYFGQSVYES
jgi:hypothetical protein